jgi:hypothetical protein
MKAFRGEAMKNTDVFSRMLLLLYRFILPSCTLFLLLIVSNNLERPLFLGSMALDLLARIWIAFGYCYISIVLSDIDKYMLRIYRLRVESSIEPNSPTNWQNIIIAGMLCIVSVPITWWVIQFFLPIFSGTDWLFALLEGLLLSAPIAFRRKKFMA